MVGSISSSQASGLAELLLGMRREGLRQEPSSTQEGALTAGSAPSQPSSARRAASANLLSGNFFDSGYERSGYVRASLENRQLASAHANKMNAMMNSLLSRAAIWDAERNFGGAVKIENTYVIGTRLAGASAMAANRIRQEEALEHSEKNLDELKDEVERRAAEAARDAEGNPLGALPGKNLAADPLPGISGTGKSQAADPIPEIPAAEASFAHCPSMPQPGIDITV